MARFWVKRSEFEKLKKDLADLEQRHLWLLMEVRNNEKSDGRLGWMERENIKYLMRQTDKEEPASN